jgi:bisphosphoglycerate-dependent phosphoglycerate mutase
VQRRAIRTAEISLDSCDRHWIPVRRSWRLNERHYGALQGKDKKQTLAEFGEEQFMLWRRSYDTPPPPLADDDEFSQAADPRYAQLPDELRPRTECLADVVDRMLPYWYDAIVPDLLSGRTVLVAAHGNSLRALVKHLDGIDPETIAGLNIPTGIPLLYRLDAQLRPTVPGGGVPRPRGRESRHRGGQEPGPLTASAQRLPGPAVGPSGPRPPPRCQELSDSALDRRGCRPVRPPAGSSSLGSPLARRSSGLGRQSRRRR